MGPTALCSSNTRGSPELRAVKEDLAAFFWVVRPWQIVSSSICSFSGWTCASRPEIPTARNLLRSSFFQSKLLDRARFSLEQPSGKTYSQALRFLSWLIWRGRPLEALRSLRAWVQHLPRRCTSSCFLGECLRHDDRSAGRLAPRCYPSTASHPCFSDITNGDVRTCRKEAREGEV